MKEYLVDFGSQLCNANIAYWRERMIISKYFVKEKFDAKHSWVWSVFIVAISIVMLSQKWET